VVRATSNLHLTVPFRIMRAASRYGGADRGAGAWPGDHRHLGREIVVGVRPEVLKNAEQIIPLGRGGQPIEAAGRSICSAFPNYVSGQTLVVTGGRP
jgi:3-oxoacyl-[acyl-carrier protein] reductase